MALVPIPGTTFVRDTNSMGLINKDHAGLEEYNAKRRMAANQKEEINNIKTEINSVKSDLMEIKFLMNKLLEKNTNG
jgi:hypothetical protein